MRALLSAATAIAIVVCAVTISSVAHADVVPVDDCSKKQEGDPCTTESKKDGACGKRSQATVNNATDPPTTGSRTYVGCVEGATPTVKAKRCSIGFATNVTTFDASLFAMAGALLVRRRRRRTA